MEWAEVAENIDGVASLATSTADATAFPPAASISATTSSAASDETAPRRSTGPP